MRATSTSADGAKPRRPDRLRPDGAGGHRAYEPPERRLVDDDLALSILPAGQRAIVRAMRWPLLRRLTISAGERAVPGSWALIACRKRFIDDKLDEALGHRRRRRSRCGHGHQGVPPRASIRHSGLRGRPSGQHRAQEGRRAARDRCGARSVHLVPLDFERDDLIGTLTAHGYRTDARTFFIWEGVTQYLTEDAVRATLGALQAAPAGSRLVFTYVRQDFIDGVNMYDAACCTSVSGSGSRCGGSAWTPTRLRHSWRIRLATRRAGGADYFCGTTSSRPVGSHRVAARMVGIRGEVVVPDRPM